ncbi:hypothetical protein GW916_12105 [bacterium]|nr:hypothetical protein [bacterium]
MFKILLSRSVFAVALLMPFLAHSSVWENENSWSPQWERAYQNWVSENWTKDYFNKPGPFKGLKFDCADLVYTMRAVFASQNGLPFAVNDPTGGGRLISNSMSRFDNLDSNARKRAFVKYLFGVVSTKSIPDDTYPAAVNRTTLSSGSVLLADEKSHHSWTVRKFLPSGIPYLLFRSRPAKTEMFRRIEYPSMGFTFPNGLNPERHAGFRNFRSVSDLTKSVWNVSGYSLEQYQIPYDSWRSRMQQKMAQRGESAEEMLSRLLDSACRGSEERVEAVQEGLNHLKKLDREGRLCMNSSEYDDFSTPSRDKRLVGNYEDLVRSYQGLRAQGQLGEGKYAKIATGLLFGQVSTGYCDINVPGVGRLNLGQVIAAGLERRFSGNPHDSARARWGFEGQGRRAKSCPTY